MRLMFILAGACIIADALVCVAILQFLKEENKQSYCHNCKACTDNPSKPLAVKNP